MPETRLHTCVLCEATCGITVQLEEGRVTGIRGDRDDPFSRGHVCPKAAALPDVMNHPDRIREPMRRIGDRWEPVSWDEALAEAADRITAIQRTHGRNAVGMYVGNPAVHGHGAILGIPLLSKALGGRSRFSATSVDQLPQMLAALEMFGHQLLFPVPDVDRTGFLLVLGANPIASNGSLMTAPGIAHRLSALRARGGRLVVVDPRRTETAAVADRHVAVRPGGDAALLLGILHVLFAERLDRPGRLADFTDGLDRLREIAARHAPERVAARAGVAPEAIRSLAREFAASPTAVCYGRVGISTQEFGGIASWLVNALNLVTGNLDRAGGAMFTTPAADVVALNARLGSLGSFGRFRSRVRGLPEFGGELPVATLAEEIETPGDGRIRGLITFAGNPVLSAPNGRRLDRALAGLEFQVAIDLYRNETTRHAHLILPPTFGLERDHYDLVFNGVAVRNVARYVKAVVTPPPGVRDDWDILLGLAFALRARGGGGRRRNLGTTLRVARALGPRRILGLLLRFGPHPLSIGTLERAPHGVDLGPLQPRLPGRLFTPDRRIRLVPQVFEEDLARLDAALDAVPVARSGDLLLIGRRRLRSNNSWMHNVARLVKGPVACTLMVHPEDAAARGLAPGGEARVRSR
ncbi:MAG: dehydrogenase, partial [Anaeromyxobacteraceae bacterium]|nr:dehydrogenase [Anaeromyxobacteraceae bacterium]